MKGWHGVDLDGTLAHYEGWSDGQIGAPIPKMAARVRTWIANDEEFAIVTARVSVPAGLFGEVRRQREEEVKVQRVLIREWVFQHFGVWVRVTSEKDFAMIDLYDDRAIQVIPNTGERVDGGD